MEEFLRAGGRTMAATVAGFMNPPPPPSSAAASTSTATTRPAVVAPPPASADSSFVREYCTPNLHQIRNHRPFHLELPSQSSPSSSSNEYVAAMKAQIVAHPRYSSLVASYVDCQKVGAPPDVASRLSAATQEVEARKRPELGCGAASNDPELDQFMEAYQQMLDKYREELMKPLQEAMEFINSVESQFNSITNASFRVLSADWNYDTCSSEEDQSGKVGETDQVMELDPRAEDKELKNHLLKKYSGYLSSLRKELSKKKKKGKLPKEAKQKLLHWWELHYKWPYPSETEKMALAESTGLDQKQINNWFINQRKRHWKPSEDMHFMAMDGYHYPPTTANVVYMDGYLAGNGLQRVIP